MASLPAWVSAANNRTAWTAPRTEFAQEGAQPRVIGFFQLRRCLDDHTREAHGVRILVRGLDRTPRQLQPSTARVRIFTPRAPFLIAET